MLLTSDRAGRHCHGVRFEYWELIRLQGRQGWQAIVEAIVDDLVVGGFAGC